MQHLCDVLVCGWSSQYQARQQFFPTRPIAGSLDHPNEIVEPIVYRCWKRYADALLWAVGQQRVGVDPPPSGHLPAPSTEVVYRGDARLTRI
jgi:hypothetical protein